MEKNIKDSNTEVSISVKDMYFSVSYTKTHKLITALYMVTDIIDKEEPIRGKLRNLGAEIISDMHAVPVQAGGKISEVVSFLNIASAMSFISEMNCNILKKEFLELKASIQESIDKKPKWLADFFTNPAQSDSPHPSPLLVKERRGTGSIGHKGHTRIGVQKGSTLMKAITDMSNKIPTPHEAGGFRPGFDALKKERREKIINIIKTNVGGASIKDILSKINTGNAGHIACSEKTLQRELFSMNRDGVLDKTGEKRWSRYQVRG